MTPQHLIRNTGRSRLWLASVVAVLGLLTIVYLSPSMTGALMALADPAVLSDLIERIGPLAVVALLALAVIVSPIPSGPVAMAAGALYGTLEGGALTAAGALLGAMGAFGLSRGLGFRPLSASTVSAANWITRPRSDRSLALAVFVSRLIPFVSFDAVSYLAGLTTIRPFTFAFATAAGVLPASFAFAAMGAGMAGMDSALMMAAALGVTLVLPVLWFVASRMRALANADPESTRPLPDAVPAHGRPAARRLGWV